MEKHDALIIKEMRRDMDALEDAFYNIVQYALSLLDHELNPQLLIYQECGGGPVSSWQHQVACEAWNNGYERERS